MSTYLLIDSRGPFDSPDADYLPALAGSLLAAGHEVTLFLVQNAVLAARASCDAGRRLEDLRTRGARVIADEVSLHERAVTATAKGVDTAGMSDLVQLLVGSTRVLWH